MTVKEVFELRKQGKIEEAYEAIRPMYAVHKGHYTTLCMFWTGNDIMKKRLKEGRTTEARKIFEALLRMLPSVEDRDGRAHNSILYDAIVLSKETADFSVLSFLERYGVGQLRETDWKGIDNLPAVGGVSHQVPSPAHQLLARAFHEIQQQPTADSALKAMPLLQEALRRTPNDKHCLSYMAVVYNILGESQKAADIIKTDTHHPQAPRPEL